MHSFISKISVILSFCIVANGSPRSFDDNFLIYDDLLDGEHEVKIRFNGVSATQTYVGPQEGIEEGILVRRVSDGIRLVSMIYNGILNVTEPELKTCDFVSDPESVDEFLEQFSDETIEAKRAAQGGWKGDYANSTFSHLSTYESIPYELRPLVEFRALKTTCKFHHKQVRKSMKIAKKHQLQENNKPGHSRARRSINELFILPGTKWCGSKNLAENNELDGFSLTDQCCRIHDHCPYNILGMSRKYTLFNVRLTTISHCGCDIRFRTCLKHAATGAANVVGNVFFNYMKTSCFTFKKVKTCVKYSWWGRCEKWGRQKRAVLQDPMPWNTKTKTSYY